MKKIAFVIGEGIGNQIEQVPSFELVKQIYSKAQFDIINTIPHCLWFTQYLYKNKERVDNIYTTKTLPKNYNADGKIITPYVIDIKPLANIKNLSLETFNNIEKIYNSEVLTNIKVVSHDKFSDDIFNIKEYLPINEQYKDIPKYDIILHNGCNKNVSIKNLWNVKLYPHIAELAKLLVKTGFSVASIGKKDEYINHTDNLTEKPIEESIELIRNCQLFISNDTGTFHIAGALKKPGIVIFTATSPWKNYDKNFHKTIEVIRRVDLDCSPCQKKGNGYWTHCNHKTCRKINPKQIYKIAKQILEKKNKKKFNCLKDQSKVSIITRCYNRLEYTVNCINKIYQLSGNVPFEHIVIDQGSTDGTRQWLTSLYKEDYYDHLKIKLNTENTGDAGGMKDGFELSNINSKYIMQFDSDCMPITDSFLEKLVNIMDDDISIGILMMFREGIHSRIEPIDLHNNEKTKQLLGRISKATCCFIIRRKLLQAINLWNQPEDIGWGYKISEKVRELGYKIMKTINIKVSHIDGTTLQAMKYPIYHNSRNSNKTNYREVNYELN